MGSSLYADTTSGLSALVKSGKLTVEDINNAVRRVYDKNFIGIMDYYLPAIQVMLTVRYQALCLEAGKKVLYF